MTPHWLTMLAIASLVLAAFCALVIVADIAIGNRQHMWIMDVVWPVTALFGSVVALYAYFKVGRLATHRRVVAARERGEEPPHTSQTPFWVKVGKGATHCGSGCTLGDICAEWLAFTAPAVATWFGWKWLFAEEHKIFAVWILDYLFAFAFGIAFQYYTIKPMRDLSVRDGLVQAFKADALSLTAWQVGMYGFMAIAHFWIFGQVLGAKLRVDRPEFWFMMQIAMIAGFFTSYPVNWWLLRKGIKEAM